MTEKIKFQLEYEIRSSPRILYSFIAELNGLSQWFADNVRLSGTQYIFTWDDEENTAELVLAKENKLVRFRFLDDAPEYYFEMSIVQDEITNDIALCITDFATQENLEDRKLIWDAQIQNLHSLIGG